MPSPVESALVSKAEAEGVPDRRRKLVLGLSVSVVATLLALLLAEGAFRLLGFEEQLLDERSESYWKVRLRRAIEEQGAAFPVDQVYDAALGWRMKPNYARDGVHHDARGFRIVPGPVQPGARGRVVVLGASMAYGLGVRDEEVFVARLASASGLEFVNAGVNAYGADQVLLLWEREAVRLAPRRVLLVEHVDDFHRNGLAFRDGPKPHFVRAGEGFRLAGVPVPPRDTLLASGRLDVPGSLRLASALGFLQRRVERTGRGDAPSATEGRRLQALHTFILTRLRDSVRAIGADLTIVLAGHCSNGAHPFGERSILDAARELDVPVVNTIAPMRASDYASYFGSHCHWSARGHALVADLLRTRFSATGNGGDRPR